MNAPDAGDPGEPSTMFESRALWIEGPQEVALRKASHPSPAAGEVMVESLFGAISRGTEALVLSGRVPESEWERMRAPFQEGDFPFPVKYGYATVGRVISDVSGLAGKTVFCLHPHQDRFVVPRDQATVLPDGLPPERAVLAANMETALNIVWDAGIGPGDRVAVIGGGVVGALAAYLSARIPGSETTLVDINPQRRTLADVLGISFAEPDETPRDCDVTIHASASQEGLGTAIEAAGFEARIVEASWYGEQVPSVPLGGAFHSRRLSIVGSQVGHISPARRARWSHARRMEKALSLLCDPRLDMLISGETGFAELARDYVSVLAAPGTLCHRIRYK